MMNSRPTGETAARILAAFFLVLAAHAARADKTDLIYMRNGDRLTGEIKNMERGRLKLSTDSMGTIYIEWKDIERVTSKELYVAELEDGTRLDGTLADGAMAGTLLLKADSGNRELAMRQVVWLDPLKLDAVLIKRWDGSVSAGFDTTRANRDTSVTASFSARRRAEDFILNFDGSLYANSRDDADNSLRASTGAGYKGLLEDRWYWAALGGVERNDELGIDLRSLLGAGYGRFLMQTGRSLWSLTGGLAVVNEQRAGDESSDTNLEGFVDTDFEFFTYDTPKTSFTTSLSVFPGITDSGRWRANLALGLRQEIITDLFVELSLYDSFDNRPPDEGVKNDYGVVTSLGYTF